MKFIKTVVPAIILLAIILICFGRTLGNYFLADDFSAISYASKICSGHWDLLLSNFTGNSVQVATMKVYRPWLLVSLVFDFALWRVNAFGYYLTNMLFMFGSSVMLYAVLRQMTKFWDKSRSIAVSLLSAGLFASSPLHSEAISFVVGRVDIICCFYYLASLWCFLRRGMQSSDRKLLGLGILCFWLAILTKEMAITLPVLVTGIGFLFPDILGSKFGNSMADRLRTAIQFSLPLWISTAIYFVIRYLTLGTFVGGYTGSIGANQWEQMLSKWGDLDTLMRIFYPLNAEVFGASHQYHDLLAGIYYLLGALILARFFNKGLPWRWLGFVVIWIIAALVPIYQLWGLGYNLEGERFLFFFTLPFAALMPFCLFADDGNQKEKTNRRVFELTGLIALTALTAVNIAIAYKNNIPWVHAGQQTKACLLQAQALGKQMMGSSKQAILLGLPFEHGGAHMILNGATFRTMMAPPFCQTSYADRFIVFAPIFYGNSQLLNTQRFKQCLQKQNIAGVYAWNEDKLNFKQLDLSKAAQVTLATAIKITTSGQGREILIASLKLNPYQYDFVEFELARTKDEYSQPIKAYWKYERQENDDWHDIVLPEPHLIDSLLGV